jgi:hypothetical protein
VQVTWTGLLSNFKLSAGYHSFTGGQCATRYSALAIGNRQPMLHTGLIHWEAASGLPSNVFMA